MTQTVEKPRKRRSDAGKPKELSEAHKRKMQKGRERKKAEAEKAAKKAADKQTREAVKRLEAFIEKTRAAQDKAHEELQRHPESQKAFDKWIKLDEQLLSATVSLAANKARLNAT